MTAEILPPSAPVAEETLRKVAGAEAAYQILFNMARQEALAAGVQPLEFVADLIWSRDLCDPYRTDPNEPVVVLKLLVDDGTSSQARDGLWRSIDRKFGSYLDGLQGEMGFKIDEAIGFSVHTKSDWLLTRHQAGSG